MKKNIASQKIGAQLVSATDGSAFTGSVTVYVTGDAGTQAVGSVSSGACTHEGNGYHTYAPAQAETNYDLVAFTFVGTGAVPATVQVFTRPATDYASQTSVDDLNDMLVTIDGIVDSILLDTAEIGAAGAGLTALATQASVTIIDDFLDTEIAAIKAKTDNLPAAPASTTNITAGTITTVTNLTNAPTSGDLTATMKASVNTEIDTALADIHLDHLLATTYDPASKPGSADALLNELVESDSGVSRFTANALEQAPSGGLDAAGVRAAVGLASANLDTQLSTIDTVVDAVKVKTDQFVFTVANQVDSNALSGAGGLDAAGVRAAVGLASANLDTQLSTIDTVVDSILVDTVEIGVAGAGLTALATQSSVTTIDDFLDTEIAAIKAVTDAIGATGSGLTNIPWNAAWDTEVQSECADALAALVIEGSLDLVEVMKVLLAFAAGKTDITGSTYTFRDQADTLNRISATVTAGERTAVTLNVT